MFQQSIYSIMLKTGWKVDRQPEDIFNLVNVVLHRLARWCMWKSANRLIADLQVLGRSDIIFIPVPICFFFLCQMFGEIWCLVARLFSFRSAFQAKIFSTFHASVPDSVTEGNSHLIEIYKKKRESVGWLVGCVLRQINPCRLFLAKFCLSVYIKYI